MTHSFAVDARRNAIVISMAFACLLLALSVGLLLTNQQTVLYFAPLALFAIPLLLVILRKPDWGLLLSIFLIVVQKTPNLPGVGVLFTISELIFLLTAFAWITQSKSQLQIIKPDKGLVLAFVVYVVAACASLLDPFPGASVVVGFAELAARIYLMVYLFVIAAYATNVHRYRQVLTVWVGSAVFVVGLTALAIVCRTIGYDPIGLSWPSGDLLTLFRNPQALAAYVTGTVLAFLPLALTRQATDFPRVRKIAQVCLPLLLITQALSESQTGWLTIPLVALCIWPLLRLFRPLAPILVLAVLAAATLGLVFALNFLQDPNGAIPRAFFAIGYETHRLPRRVELLTDQLHTIDDSPMLGVGIGQVGRYNVYKFNLYKKKESHFTIIGIIAETGIVGLLAVFLIMLMFLKIMYQNALLPLDKNSGWIQLNEGLTMGLIGMLIFGLTQDVQTNRTMWLILTLIVAFKVAFLSKEAATR